jgi:hypothetical protein
LNGKNKEELKEYKNRLKEIENIDEEEWLWKKATKKYLDSQLFIRTKIYYIIIIV